MTVEIEVGDVYLVRDLGYKFRRLGKILPAVCPERKFIAHGELRGEGVACRDALGGVHNGVPATVARSEYASVVVPQPEIDI